MKPTTKYPFEHVGGPLDHAVREAMVHFRLRDDFDKALGSVRGDVRVLVAYVLEVEDHGLRMLRMRLLAAPLSDEGTEHDATARVNLARFYEAYIMGEERA
jgi:hypothetical protein